MAVQYRPLIMLAIGITFVYAIISLHSAPFPYPQIITVSREDLFGKVRPNGIFISVQKDWVYLTAIWKAHEVNYEDATGMIRQYRRPLHLILSRDNYDPNNNWQLLYNHRLDGPITHISSFYYNDGSLPTYTEYNENNALAILYQLYGKEEIKYKVRFYHIGNYEEEINNDTNELGECQNFSPHTCHIEPSFKYQDIILPGTTKIKSFHVDGSIILYSRSPDDAKFRTILMPENIFDIPKSRIDALTLKSSDPGMIQKIGRFDTAFRKTSTFRRVYAV
ncbi:hypothetical protein C1645_818146 [Glomus cerebriforme]|uniref:Uncharacterized protein n=1 Tax=Glomus cerebriforme TaxID=658196 RepID=A0A397T8X7_9GLOM|nr:hypothetical protein C1645_818146 [Glomus cerebriforme]